MLKVTKTMNEQEETKNSPSGEEKVEEAAEVAKEAAEKAEESADKASEAVEEVKETAEVAKEEVAEVKEEIKEETPKAQEPKVEEVKKAPLEVSKKLEDIIVIIEKLTVLELSDLVKALEERFGVTASAPMAVAAGATPAAAAGETAATEEIQTSFNVILAESGANKISVIKAVREIVPSLGLKEAKDLVDAAPKPVLEGAGKDAANEAKTKLEAAGAKVELQ